MSFFKFLFASIMFSSVPLSPGENGWYPVEKNVKTEEISEENESIWVLFIKDLGEERFQVSLPKEPKVRKNEAGELEVESEHEGERFQILVKEKESSFESTENWAHEKLIPMGRHLLHLKAETPSFEKADRFFSSVRNL